MVKHLPYELVIDVGNSRMKMGLFAAGKVTARTVASHGDIAAVERFITEGPPGQIAIGSVAAPDEKFLAALSRIAPVVEIAGNSPSPVRSLYAAAAAIGVDRLANIAGAALLFPRRSVVVIDLGTCITYDLVDELAVHQGGIISPGMRMRARAMHTYSARLPEVGPEEDPPLLGTDTASSLAAGVHHGLLMELQGHIAVLRQQHPGLAVVLTGGDALRFARALKSGIFAHPTLTLIGLHALSHFHPDRSPVVGP
ncbi:MAG: type III pantothenate kinase [Flavobacteriales bacterium]|nr:type III pantothenate kinase [Flavobacteriales bacterium]MBK7248910.1 type III pantothenate kinase [Flavobacteriales bacterium]MBK7288205.1 type III pantothenate kinase [Flavobacteriales bacterium]MBK9600058.1 type III pantothenate kinase [Flavobacteriales bacterium]QQS74152.1 MAG: type III pantothenate kinase [Flavobacteriales bacterium]